MEPRRRRTTSGPAPQTQPEPVDNSPVNDKTKGVDAGARAPSRANEDNPYIDPHLEGWQDEPFISANPWQWRPNRRLPPTPRPPTVTLPASPPMHGVPFPMTPSQHLTWSPPVAVPFPGPLVQPLPPLPFPLPQSIPSGHIPLPQEPQSGQYGSPSFSPGAHSPQNGGARFPLSSPWPPSMSGIHTTMPYNSPPVVPGWIPFDPYQLWNSNQPMLPAPVIPPGIPIYPEFPSPQTGGLYVHPGSPFGQTVPSQDDPEVTTNAWENATIRDVIFNRGLPFFWNLVVFALDQAYLYFLLRIPALYFTRVARVVDDSELSQKDIQAMALTADGKHYLLNWSHPTRLFMYPAVSRFKESWEELLNSLMEEWRTQNILSVLLLSAVLTMLQIEGIEGDPVSRTATLLSLICALMSLLYGCLYMAPFGTMNQMYKAKTWADAAGSRQKHIFWNVWVFLAMPAAWLAWSLIFFSVTVLSFIWRTGSLADPEDPIRLSPREQLGPRIALSIVFGLGLVYFLLTLNTLRHYGSSMDTIWRDKVNEWRAYMFSTEVPKNRFNHPPQASSTTPSASSPRHYSTANSGGTLQGSSDPRSPYTRPNPSHPDLSSISANPYQETVDVGTARPKVFDEQEIFSPSRSFSDVIIIAHLGSDGSAFTSFRPSFLQDDNVSIEAWHDFTTAVGDIWAGTFPALNVPEAARKLHAVQILADAVKTWNDRFFVPRDLVITSTWHTFPGPSYHVASYPGPPSHLLLALRHVSHAPYARPRPSTGADNGSASRPQPQSQPQTPGQSPDEVTPRSPSQGIPSSEPLDQNLRQSNTGSPDPSRLYLKVLGRQNTLPVDFSRLPDPHEPVGEEVVRYLRVAGLDKE
ncbi:hypothetical protein HGRIS_003923 [Hohenbuehelia grisea]|uniref:Uncharacterized protein n=1 Tax=Hohenbuehelia grisea TaxID=104357 RepID=A0ABR3JHK1_9AGAR